MTDKTIYELELHEHLKVRESMWATRVPGGWIYQSTVRATENGEVMGYSSSTVFVPYNSEQDPRVKANEYLKGEVNRLRDIEAAHVVLEVKYEALQGEK